MAEEQKKGFFGRLFGTQKKGGCCSYRIEEISEKDGQDGGSEQGAPKSGGSCCGSASKTEHTSTDRNY